MDSFTLIVLGIFVGGAVLVALAWRLTRGLPTCVRLLPTTFIVALAIAPGVIGGEGGMAIVPAVLVLFSAPQVVLGPIGMEWAAFYIVSVVVHLFNRLVARRYKSPWQVMLLAGIAAVVTVIAAGHCKVGQRVASIDFKAVYPNIQPYGGGSGSCEMAAGVYPNLQGTSAFAFKTPHGGIALDCTFRDEVYGAAYFRDATASPTSQPIGSESFFDVLAGTRIRLNYRRHNLGVIFSGTDKAEMEEAARNLDAAIMKGNPKIRMQDIELRQVTGFKLSVYFAPLSWILYICPGAP